MKTELFMVNEKLGENTSIHHLFTRTEIRKALVRILGNPETDEEHRFLQNEVKKAFNKMPQYAIENNQHKDLHKNKVEILDLIDILDKPTLDELINGGIKCFEKDKGEVIKLKTSLIKRITGQIYGYVKNYKHDNFAFDEVSEK